MGKSAGFKGGKVYGSTVVAKGSSVIDAYWIPASQFDVTYISGTAAVVSGLCAGVAGNLAWAEKSYGFQMSSRNYAGFNYVTPGHIGPNVRTEYELYWTSSGVAVNRDAVVWDIDYLGFSKYVSGAVQSGYGEGRKDKYDVLSAIFFLSPTNTTTTSKHGIQSGALNVAVLGIAASNVKPNQYCRCLLYRDAGEAADTLLAQAIVLGVMVQFVD